MYNDDGEKTVVKAQQDRDCPPGGIGLAIGSFVTGVKNWFKTLFYVHNKNHFLFTQN